MQVNAENKQLLHRYLNVYIFGWKPFGPFNSDCPYIRVHCMV